jgi:hypothetical protein
MLSESMPTSRAPALRRTRAAASVRKEWSWKYWSLQQPAEGFTTNRDFLRGVARLGGFLARKSAAESDWQTIWKGWFVLMILIEGYELAQTVTSPK